MVYPRFFVYIGDLQTKDMEVCPITYTVHFSVFTKPNNYYIFSAYCNVTYTGTFGPECQYGKYIKYDLCPNSSHNILIKYNKDIEVIKLTIIIDIQISSSWRGNYKYM